MNTQFLIVAGGTGIRIAEAYIHLCACGIGPAQLHLLVIDTDATNGNLERFRHTLKAYQNCREVEWKVPSGEGDLFGTKIKPYFLTDELEVRDHGIGGLDCTPADYSDLLDLFFTEDEQGFGGERGFLARPNLGSLLIGKHITDAFVAGNSDAQKFLEALRNEMNAGTKSSSLVVAGSVFGGTGASVIPVIGSAVEEALKKTARGGQAENTVQTQWSELPKAAIMMLPYFLPQEPGASEAEGETVDPSRFLADTSNSLAFYHQTGAWKQYNNVYVLGSDRPERHRPNFCSGSHRQANAPFIEELVGALAAVHSPNAVSGGATVFAYEPAPGSSVISLSDMPIISENDGARRFARFLHLGAFMIRVGKNPLDFGVIQFLQEFRGEDEELEFWPWMEQLLQATPDELRDALSKSETKEKAFATYFFRLLQWAKFIFKSRNDLAMFDLSSKGSAFHLWELLSVVQQEGGFSELNGGKGSAASILGCGAFWALEKPNETARRSDRDKRLITDEESHRDAWLSEGCGPEKVILPITEESLEASREYFQIADSDEFSRTEA